MDRIITYVEQIDPNFKTNHHWYAGITGRPEERPDEHERDKKIQCRYYKFWRTTSEEVARNIEKKLGKMGFAIHKKDLVPIKETALRETISKETASEQVEKRYVYVFQAVKDN